ncbi:hypothetical protein GGH19_000710 [Coemansia sp. RSA 1807]|nr:hypothetical protein IW142_004006 [Coemansia sp. RSA 564]KAJ2173309.1 hypothetical protein GGH16_001906 [Coemansia sp. RSA 560]KAJ2250783.1 hypothetical protein GGH97_000439 [Coemansia sp. RSA 475]KAJ2270807.1 hypothetical protein EV176_004191 [Coemansia sp. RSA 451]KAJ2410088.1 hypothetical protein J3F80_000827 [Coemansia sp. RSA 2526]KAJ2529333.1 hypothetical protein GGH20_002275 [Coemansia sp. RSA 1937]KAJ2534524.1 hypothetical protein IWW43_002335 [Coemansia sp. RSA 1935]KAJ2578134.1 
MNFGGDNNNSNSFAAPSFGDKLRMGFSQLQDSFKDLSGQFTLAKECERAARIISEFVVPPKFGDVDDIIPADVLQHCRGIAVLTIIKAGVIWSGRAGVGLVCSRLPDGSWSGPSAISTGGIGIGGQIGAQMTEVVMILNTEDAVRAFEENAGIQLGSNISVAAGPLGRSGELSAAVNTSNVAAVYSYSKSKGLFAGVSLEGSAVLQRKDVNQEFYGRTAPAEMILSGEIKPPQGISELEVLQMVLNERCVPPPRASSYQHPGQQRPGQQRPGQQRQFGSETLYDEDAVHIGPNTAAAMAAAGANPATANSASPSPPQAPTKP